MKILLSPPVTDGRTTTYNNLGPFTRVTKEVTDTVTNNTNYYGDGIENDYTDDNDGIKINHVGSVNEIKKCNKLVNELNVTVVPNKKK